MTTLNKGIYSIDIQGRIPYIILSLKINKGDP